MIVRAIRALAATLAAALAAASVAAQAPEWSTQAQRRLQAGPESGDNAAWMAERLALLESGERSLMRNDTAAAQQAFDRASLLLHAADVEVALVRTYMQAGDYRRAVGFAAHAAGAHRETSAAAALYAWLLRVGGQDAAASRTIDAALDVAPSDAALGALRLSMRQDRPPALAGLRALRLGPYSSGDEVPADALSIGTAMLLPDGLHAVVPLATLRETGSAWLRNGRGQTVSGVVLKRASDIGVAVLGLTAALPVPAAGRMALQAPFAGSPASTVEYDPGQGSEPVWPRLRLGFFGRPAAAGGHPSLWIQVPSGPRGGPVFDQWGRVAGLALRSADGTDRLVSSSALRLAAEAALLGEATGPAGDAVQPDAVYEQALLLGLQVLVAP